MLPPPQPPLAVFASLAPQLCTKCTQISSLKIVKIKNNINSARAGVGGLLLDNFATSLPLKKGLSSSAAFCVLLARAYNRL